jgi:uncharacterized protein YgiM (DUF1202 family)
MHIFVADEHPLAVFANTCRRALQIPPSAGFRDIADVREKGGSGECAQMAAVPPFLESPASRGQLTNRAAIISDRSAAFDGFGCRRNVKRRTPMRSRIAVLISALAGALLFSALPTNAAITHTTTNLNLRAGPGTHHRVKAIIPAGAPIDIESCGDTWCYMAWAGHVGYVKHQYLMHHVTAEVPPLIHVTHVHKHGLINF